MRGLEKGVQRSAADKIVPGIPPLRVGTTALAIEGSL